MRREGQASLKEREEWEQRVGPAIAEEVIRLHAGAFTLSTERLVRRFEREKAPPLPPDVVAYLPTGWVTAAWLAEQEVFAKIGRLKSLARQLAEWSSLLGAARKPARVTASMS